MNVTSIIATSGRPELLLRTLRSLERARKPEGYRGLILVENGPRRDFPALARDHRFTFPIDYHHLPVANKSRALNDAVRRVERGLIYFHDDDVLLGPDALVSVAAAAGRYGARHFFGGPVSADREQTPPRWLERRLPHSSRGWECPVPVLEDGCGHTFLGANWAAFADDLRGTAVFSHACGPNQSVIGEETLLQTELMAKGFRGVYVPEAPAAHYVPVDRLSPAWALSRARKRGLYIGLFRSRKERDFFPVLRADVHRGFLFLYRGLKSRRREVLFEGCFWWCVVAGKLEGLLRRIAGTPDVSG
jgi:glycosyltransferase involved in cell wall biosynthesis